jgi:hypothetical protein
MLWKSRKKKTQLKKGNWRRKQKATKEGKSLRNEIFVVVWQIFVFDWGLFDAVEFKISTFTGCFWLLNMMCDKNFFIIDAKNRQFLFAASLIFHTIELIYAKRFFVCATLCLFLFFFQTSKYPHSEVLWFKTNNFSRTIIYLFILLQPQFFTRENLFVWNYQFFALLFIFLYFTFLQIQYFSHRKMLLMQNYQFCAIIYYYFSISSDFIFFTHPFNSNPLFNLTPTLYLI